MTRVSSTEIFVTQIEFEFHGGVVFITGLGERTEVLVVYVQYNRVGGLIKLVFFPDIG